MNFRMRQESQENQLPSSYQNQKQQIYQFSFVDVNDDCVLCARKLTPIFITQKAMFDSSLGPNKQADRLTLCKILKSYQK